MKPSYRFILLSFIIFCNLTSILGQSNNIIKQAKEAINSTNSSIAKMDSMIKYQSKLYRLGHFDEAYHWSQEGIRIAESKNDITRLMKFKILSSRYLGRNGKNLEAIDIIKSIIAEPGGQYDEYEAYLYKNLSRYYSKENLFEIALKYSYLSDSLYKVRQPKGRSAGFIQRAYLYSKQGLNHLAFESAEQAYDLYLTPKDTVNKLWLLYSICEIALIAKEIEKYGDYAREYEEMSKTRKSKFHKGIFNLGEEDINLHIENLQKVKGYFEKTNYKRGVSLARHRLVSLYMTVKNYDLAYRNILDQENTIIKNNFENSIYSHYQNKYEVERKLGLFNQAVSTADVLFKMRDSFQNTELANLSLDLAKKYETQAKDDEITILNKENMLKDLRIQKENFSKWIFGLGSLALLFFSTFLYKNIQSKKAINKVLAEKNSIINENLKEKETLLKEIHHRVKNNLQIISSLLRLQSRTIDDPSTKEALLDGQNRVQSMALIHQNLYKTENLTGVEVKDYFEKLCNNLLETYNISKEKIKLSLDITTINLDVSTLIPLGLVVNEIFTNSLKYAFHEDTIDPEIGASLQLSDENVLQLKIFDNGIGISDKMVEYLNAENNRSRKKEWGFGMRLLHTFSKKLEAKMSAHNNNGTYISLDIGNFKIVKPTKN